MEHKLITGGEKYLPFARSRIKALRATGLNYASQRFEMGDGTVEVRIAWQQDYIRLSGGASIEMDSGVVSAPFSAGLFQEYDPGILEESTYAATYNAPFVGDAGKRRLNPSQGSVGQLSGRVTYAGGFKGSVPPDRTPAISFSPQQIFNADAPPVAVPRTDDDLLYIKKATCAACPPSIFTGKARLYVQAMYGRPLYNAGVPGKANPVPRAAGPTALLLDAYKRGGVTPEPAQILISTASGVWLDTATGKHWLFNITGVGILAYPLIGTSTAEAMRKQLVSPSKLSDEDANHLEALILSTCLPDPTLLQVLAGPSIGPAYSMGYSWHWAWSTPVATIVVNGSYWAGGYEDNFGMESTRHSLKVTPAHATDEDGRIVSTSFSTSSAVVEGPVRWAVKRSSWVIVEPDWGRGMVKTTAKGARPIACEGFFYAFYNRDELKVCRINVVELTGIDVQESSGEFFEPWRNFYFSTGVQPAYADILTAQPIYWDCTLSVGAATYVVGPLGDVKYGMTWRVNVTDTGVVSAGNPSYGNPTDGYEYAYGPPSGNPGQPRWASSRVFYGAFYETPGATGKEPGRFHLCNVVRERSAKTVDRESQMVAMVPSGDAEALFVYIRKYTTTQLLDRNVNLQNGQANYLEDQVIYFNNGSTVMGTRELWVPHDGGFGFTANTAPSTSVSENGITNVLICGAGTVPSIFPPTGEFFTFAVDDIQGLYHSLCSTRDVVLAADLVEPRGITGAEPLSPVIVGWA